MKKDKLVIGTRGSELALWQTNWVKDELNKAFPSIEISVNIIKTKGDKVLDVSLSKIGDKGLFTREIEQQLLDGNIDLAVHSFKDLPTVLPKGIAIGAVSKRIDQRDVLISKKYSTIDDLPNGAVVATGSLRRKSQILNYKPELKITDVRGNIKYKVKKARGIGLGCYDSCLRRGQKAFIRQLHKTDNSYLYNASCNMPGHYGC